MAEGTKTSYMATVVFRRLAIILTIYSSLISPAAGSQPGPTSAADRGYHLADDLDSPILFEGALPVTSRAFPPERGIKTFKDSSGMEQHYRAGYILLKLKKKADPLLLPVHPGDEPAALKKLQTRSEVEWVELDKILQRQHTVSDPEIPRQWHHQKLGSTNAWNLTTGTPSVTVAIVDTAFQMDHPDLAAHTQSGWNMVLEQPITSAPGFYHSTLAAGLIGAIIGNNLGVAGMVNCRLMPIDIGDRPSTSDMYRAILWASEHGVRIVNLSWDGSYSALLNSAAAELKERKQGLVFMAGVNGSKFLPYPNQPHIYAVAMTDSQDQQRSAYGAHIDFAAPGYQVFATTVGSVYAADSGTSYATPIVAGMAAFAMTVNPSLSADQVIELIKSSSLDLGPPGWDQYYGWGRVDFAQFADAVFRTLKISQLASVWQNGPVLQTEYVEGANYLLHRATQLLPPDWSIVESPLLSTNGSRIHFRDPLPAAGQRFYRLRITLP